MKDNEKGREENNEVSQIANFKLIKVCGMKFPENIREVAALQPDFMGFVFYKKSPRYVRHLDISVLDSLPSSIKKMGVFVNEKLDNILSTVYKYHLDGVQLHGSELEDKCEKLKEAGLLVIKAFPVESSYNFIVTKPYESVCDYFLFDTKVPIYGGAGIKFDWSLLNDYKGNIPFFLSGGISLEDVDDLKKIEHPKFIGVDLNSKFEIAPGKKNVELLRQFFQLYRYS